jgi:hypothetical protein
VNFSVLSEIEQTVAKTSLFVLYLLNEMYSVWSLSARIDQTMYAGEDLDLQQFETKFEHIIQ